MITWSKPQIKIELVRSIMALEYTLVRKYGDDLFHAWMIVDWDHPVPLAEAQATLLQCLDAEVFPKYTGGMPDHPNLVW